MRSSATKRAPPIILGGALFYANVNSAISALGVAHPLVVEDGRVLDEGDSED